MWLNFTVAKMSKKIVFSNGELEALEHLDLVVSDYETELMLTAWWRFRYRKVLRKAIRFETKNKKAIIKKAKARTKESMKGRKVEK